MCGKKASIWHRMISFLRGYRRKYFDYLYYLHRYVSMRGIASHGAFNLEQPEVYVDIKLMQATPDELSVGVVPTNTKNGDSSSQETTYTIWQHINRKSQPGNKIILIGSPGSGKTTVLKQITLAFCKFRDKSDLSGKIPILLLLRNHMPEILSDPNIQMISIIRDSLSKGDFICRQNWFEGKLRKGSCVVLLDGLDEIGDIEQRKKVISWIERQFVLYPKNHFIVTSRPHGISNAAINGAKIFQILPLDADQIEKFIHNWYFATERRLSLSDDDGVKMIAREGAKDLLSRIQNTESLHPLAQNGLLLTMIATLHRFDAQLPGRRVELYEQIFHVFFRRRDLSGASLLTSEQNKNVLMPLANYMMEKKLREISLTDAAKIIQKDLAEIIGESMQPVEFLRSIQEQSGLLLEVSEGLYSFASLTFQEFLASAYYAKRQDVEKLVSEIKQDWWWETIRLYCAQSDGTRIVEACLAEESVQLSQLQLAISCLEEALRVETDVRARLNNIIRQGVDNPDPVWRNTIALALLLKRLRFMDRIDSRRLIDNSLVTNVEYQIFIDDESNKGNFCPDHWMDGRFPNGKALDPVTGVRISDMQRFCEWLVPKDIWRYKFRSPEVREISMFKCDTGGNLYWLLDGENPKTNEYKPPISVRYKEWLIQQMIDDSNLFASIRVAAQREKDARPTSELFKNALPVGGHATTRSSFDITGEIRAFEAQMGEMERARQWSMMQKFRRFSARLNIDFDKFLESIRFVNIVSKQQVQNLDWIPLFPQPPEYGFDMGKEILHFANQYPENRIRSRVSKDLGIVIRVHGLVTNMLLDRSWHQLADMSDDRGEVYMFVRSMARISLLAMALVGKANHPSFSRDIANIYLMYCLLERRVAGSEKPVEGIRLVKYS